MEYLSVSEITEIIAERIEGDPYLTDVGVVGEIVGIRYRDRNVFFNIVDDGAKLPCVVFGKGRYVELKEGEMVRVIGSVRVYRKGGYYSFNVESVERIGVRGSKHTEFERVFRRLVEERILPRKRKEITGFPRRIGVITSRYSAALRDILSVFESKSAGVTVYLFHAKIQGENASEELVKAFEKASKMELDVLIVARGGGSSDDLWVFNDYEVLKSASEVPYPIVTGIGHSVDAVLMDELADYVRITPTSAAELIASIQEDYRKRFKDLEKRLENAFSSVLRETESKLRELEARLESTSPGNVLKRGFTLIRKGGEFLRSVAHILEGDEVEILFHDGYARVTVREVGRHPE